MIGLGLKNVCIVCTIKYDVEISSIKLTSFSKNNQGDFVPRDYYDAMTK